MDTKIALIVLNYNSWPETLACLDSILASSLMPQWLIVVDNASHNDSVPQLKNWLTKHGQHLNCQLLEAPTNRGYAAGNNLGLSLALELGADAVWILNNDTTITPTTLAALNQTLHSAPTPGLCGGITLYHDTKQVQSLGGGWHNPLTGLVKLYGQGLSLSQAQSIDPAIVEAHINYIDGVSVLVSRKFLEVVGLLCEDYFLYYEERDWAIRASRCGQKFNLSYAKDAVLYHHEGASTGWSKRKFNKKALLRLSRSRLLLTAKFYPLALPLVGLSLVYSALRVVWRRFLSSNKT